ncbi:hypothetical protein D8674_020518 [Pyrus ussuriensis x Pyrus communis]|uniref:Cell division control protein 73 C-terminal domain-containing protein n=1 Tax=Pyrus ussuriensis x Pyrus communis TaxID=2448454 RepID=A0A5N5HMZ9_9ROSA|nr:hypothetical protein D8674_020518 [Pyrus ussuriensis x Pyrus communis]
MIYSVKEFLEDGVYIPTDVKVKQMKRAKLDCVTVQKKFSKDRDPVVTAYEVRDKPLALKAEDWDWLVVAFVLLRFSIRLLWIVLFVFLVCSDMPLRVLPKLIGVQLVNFHVQLYFKNIAPPFEALMYEFDAENKGDNGDLHTTYTGKGKRDDSESLMSTMQRTKSRAAVRSDIITRRVKGMKLVVELTSQSGVT